MSPSQPDRLLRFLAAEQAIDKAGSKAVAATDTIDALNEVTL